jgi:hypothetical protein
VHQNAGLRLKFHVIDSQSDQFGDAQACGETEVKHGAIPDAVAVGGVRGIQDGLHLFNGEVFDKRRIGLLCWNR